MSTTTIPANLPAAVTYREATPRTLPAIEAGVGTCGKCDGRGKIEAFRHVANGTCFWCEGTGQLAIAARPEQTIQADGGLYLSMMGREYYVERIWENTGWAIYSRMDEGGMIYVADDGEVTFTMGVEANVPEHQQPALRRHVLTALEIH